MEWERIQVLQNEINGLRKVLSEKESELDKLKNEYSLKYQSSQINTKISKAGITSRTHYGDQLPRWAIVRYSRQILLSDIGVAGQGRLCAGRVLIAGAGGLGCPAALYLAGAGIGEIGIIDYDTVDITNIHRQVLHYEGDERTSKVESAARKLRSINSNIKITPYNVQLDSKNAQEIASGYDLVLDCTDNVPTRYLLNDLCVLAKIPLVSGSALKMEGQLTVYGYRADRNHNETDRSYIGPCYRCVFPTPPPTEAVGSCSANGVAGPVPGVIGALQALEAIKLVVGHTRDKMLVERLLLFDGEDMTFRTVKLRGRNPQCPVCSESPTITRLIDYEVFCKAQAKEKPKPSMLVTEKRKIEKEKRMSGQSYYGFRKTADYKRIWVQDVPKSERKIGQACSSALCARGTRRCADFDEEARQQIFQDFWNLNWSEKKDYVRSLVDVVPPKRRRCKDAVSRKSDSKLYHLENKGVRLLVCRLTFLNTLGIKEAMVRSWLADDAKQKNPKTPLKSLNVTKYIDQLPVVPPKCALCRQEKEISYLNLAHIKNLYQLYLQYLQDARARDGKPASRKTFSKVFALRSIRIFKPKNEGDFCDLVSGHNVATSDVYRGANRTGLNPEGECFYGDIDHELML